uniref:C2 domain-containing protein n=1 Tax=Globisporangium ultimum (strain ATCC 200006 / CBS 805.95 / DAOM BR144) TaxID=431595 RepID=K3WDA2_GLOUD
MDPFEELARAPVELQAKEISLSGEADDKLPNTLVVTVLQARGLHAAPLRSTLSCYVKLSSLGREFKTSVISKSDEPYWNESFSFRAVDWASSVTLSVRDKINVKMRALGQVKISSADIANLPGMSCQSWFKLTDKNGERKDGMDSEIELKVALIYTTKHDPSIASEIAATTDKEDALLLGVIADQDDETEEEAFVRRKELERQEKERKSTLYSNLKHGDYQIQVHVIEARDLKGENLSGTSDPYCQVEVMGLKKKTSTKYETLGCVFDEILFFHSTNIGRNELKQATIKISVWDKEKVMKDNFIGGYQLDCLSVHFRPHHELYRQWIAIHDHLNEKDRGIQGFLLVSISVIGPGDVLRVHDRDAEIAKELATSAASLQGATPSDMISTDTSHSVVLMPPTIDLKLHFLLVKVFRAEDLPPMDEGGLILSSGIDAFVQIGFASNSTCKSSVVTVKGTSNLSPEFLEELWIPVLAPTLSRNIVISVWDRDLGRKDEVVGISSHDYLQVPSSTCRGGILASAIETRGKASLSERDKDMSMDTEEAQDEERVEPRWFNLYGPPLRRANKKRATMICQNPELGSTYRGRVLLSMEKVESPMSSESEKFHTKRMKDAPSANTSGAKSSKTIKYVLRCALFCGADIPQFHSIASTKTKMRVTVSIGSYEIHFDSQPVRKDGRVDWEQCKERWPIILPADLTQLPDLIITLSRQLEKDDFVGVSFVRAPAADFFVKGFNAKTEWIHLEEDMSRRQTKYALDKTQSPGSLLIRVGFGREEIAVRYPWGDETELFAPFRNLSVHREIRVHIFQFRKLVIPQGKMRLPNPFVSVTCCGQTKKTAPKYKTLDPLFYESLVFMVHVPTDVVFTPDLVFRLHDANVSTSTEVPAGIFGELTVSMSKAVKSVANASVPRPSWYQLQMRNSSFSSPLIDEVKGEALISIQFVDHPGPTEHSQRLDPLTPAYEDATLEIVALGVRKLKALSALGVQRPHMEFELIGGMFSDGTHVRKSKPTKLPIDTLFAPQLRIKVCESSLGGLRKATIASCVVDLSAKLPWSIEYVPPQQQHAFENPMAAPAFTTDATEKSKHKMRFPVLKISKQRKVTGIQDAGTLKDPDDLLSDDEEDDESEKVSQIHDDGIGIGSLRLPEISLSKPSRSQLSDPALLNQWKSEEQRRYLAGRADMLQGGAQGHGGGGENTLHDNNADSDTMHKPAPYLAGRDWWITDHSGEELEYFLEGKALETYPLYRFVLTRPSLLKRKRVRTELKAGLFKGLISITQQKKKLTKTHSLLDIERLQEPQSLVVRVYVLRGSNLQSKDSNGYSDPYLRLKLGKSIISDRANHKKKTLNPDFFRMFSFNTTLPGPSQLEIGVWDHDLVLDDFIGSTTIDLEDRWFHKEWQRIGQGHPQLKEAGGCLKPIEYRHLYTSKRSTSQGFIQLWVDIMTAQQAAVLPPVNVDPPAPKKFEVRVIIWRAENITDKDNSEINDYFVKAWMEGGKADSTDVHWRCSSGKPCWNYRFKFPVEYPLRTPEFGRLHIQLWDKDVLKWNDILGEAQLDLYKWIRRAYENNRIVSPFLELKAMAKAATAEPGKFKKPTFLKKLPADTVKRARKAKEEAEAKAALNGLLGRIGISVQIVPELEAQMNPVGKGQEAPNMNPYLPPPVGRMRLSANPIMMLKELVGPKMCLRVTILYCCVGCAFFIGVFGATIMSTLTYFQGMSRGDMSSEQAPWHLPNDFRYPRNFQDPENATVVAGGGA